jgi:hypothetical protein
MYDVPLHLVPKRLQIAKPPGANTARRPNVNAGVPRELECNLRAVIEPRLNGCPLGTIARGLEPKVVGLHVTVRNPRDSSA